MNLIQRIRITQIITVWANGDHIKNQKLILKDKSQNYGNE